MGAVMQATQPNPLMQLAQVLQMNGASDMGAPAQVPVAPVIEAPQPSFAPQGNFNPADVQAMQQQQQAPEQGMAGLFGGGMDESKQQRLLLLSAALTAPGSLADKFQLMSLSQAAYTELQNAQGRDTGQKDAEAERLRLESESRIGLQGAQTDESRQRSSESAAKAPLELRNLTRTGEKLDLDLKHAKEDYEAIAAIDPKGAKRAKAKLDKIQAEVDEHKARANQANASAGEHNARATGVSQVNDARRILADPNATQVQKDQAQLVVSGAKPASAAKKDTLTVVAEYYKKANPTATDQQAAQFALDNETGAKGDLIKAAIALTESTDKADQEEGLEILRTVAKKRAGGASTPSAASAAIPKVGDTATNPRTGEKVRFSENGAWVPVKK